ncbi:MAG TPA: hypothetical protein PK287_11380 [Tenuifilaceae bacterium]|nr:hypothetical protein [Bacteroidales bacterium]HOF92432.1 hypothetical protein [Tenuifilaceae bacterium]MZP83178.1 hypothetical protein [Bacteroidales bacterium]HOQ35065.1 hypothetical protein [Tenuifilaceae bacterium]HOU63112.1 hypothetical protein [Tenuifilaceae bacterium]
MTFPSPSGVGKSSPSIVAQPYGSVKELPCGFDTQPPPTKMGLKPKGTRYYYRWLKPTVIIVDWVKTRKSFYSRRLQE